MSATSTRTVLITTSFIITELNYFEAGEIEGFTRLSLTCTRTLELYFKESLSETGFIHEFIRIDLSFFVKAWVKTNSSTANASFILSFKEYLDLNLLFSFPKKHIARTLLAKHNKDPPLPDINL